MPFHHTLISAAAGALLGLATLAAHAQPNSTTAATPVPQTKPTRAQLDQLLTPEERAAHRQQMQAAKTPEERARLRDAHRAELERRAKDKGIELPPHQAGRGTGEKAADGKGHGGRMGSAYAQLFSEQERSEFRGKMHAAATPEERAKLRDEQRTIAQARAKEKGITLPERHHAPVPKAQQPG